MANTPNKVFLNKHKIVEIHVVGEQNGASVTAMGRKIQKLLAQKDAKPLILDDISAMTKTNTMARRTVANLSRRLPFTKAAMVGDGSAIMRIGTNLLLSAVGMKNVHYFDNRSDAIKWLLS